MPYNNISADSPRHIIVQEIEREEKMGTTATPEPENLTDLMDTPEIRVSEADSVVELYFSVERDYDVEPTHLYTALQKKRWSDALTILEESPEEARTWVYRKEASGPKLRWRLLPIHGAIIFQAPTEVVETILLNYPESAAERDDEGSLPIHLAYKRAAPTAICKLLLDTFPNSIDIADRKGRTPKHLAASSNGPKHREFVYAMKSHLLAMQAARVAVRSEERLKFSAKIDECKKEYDHELKTLEKRKNSEIVQMVKKIDDLEADLRRTQGASQVLVTHVTAMEAKIAQFEANERVTTEKVGTLEGDLVASHKEHEEIEQKMKEEMNTLNQKLAAMQVQVNDLLLEKEVLSKSLEQVVVAAEAEKKSLDAKLAAKDEQLAKLKDEKEKVEAENLSLKAEIAERTANEASLSQKVASLESELKEHNHSASDAAKSAQTRLEELDIDRLELRMTVGTLTKKLRTVAGFLDDIKTEQDAIVEQANVHESEMRTSQLDHARILDELQKQQQVDAKAQSARELILSMVHMHEETYINNTAEREKIVSSIDRHSKNLSEGAQRRQVLVNNVKTLQDKIREARERVLGDLPELEDKAGEFSPRFREKAAASYKEEKEQQQQQQQQQQESREQDPVLDLQEIDEDEDIAENPVVVMGVNVDPSQEEEDGTTAHREFVICVDEEQREERQQPDTTTETRREGMMMTMMVNNNDATNNNTTMEELHDGTDTSSPYHAFAAMAKAWVTTSPQQPQQQPKEQQEQGGKVFDDEKKEPDNDGAGVRTTTTGGSQQRLYGFV